MNKITTEKNHNNKGFSRIKNAFFYSIDGFTAAFKSEEALRVDIFIFIISIPFAFFFGKTQLEIAFLIFTTFLIVLMELVNSAVESVVDLVTRDKHDLAKKAKDIGSALVFLSVMFAFFTWFLILVF